MADSPHIDVTVDLQQFAANLRAIKERAAPARLCVVVKSNAYGHGLGAIAPVAAAAGADLLGICTNPEAREIRKLGLGVRLMRLRGALPDEYEESVRELDIEEQAGTLEDAEHLAALGRERGRPVPVHLKIDTGMGRNGFFPEELEMMRRVCALPGLEIVGLMTHFADADGESLDGALRQQAAFEEVAAALRDVLPDSAALHTHNSAAFMRMPKPYGDLVRIGAACYGVRTSRHFENALPLPPVMEARTRIMAVREIPVGAKVGYGSLFAAKRPTRIATLPAGFGEGYPRSLFNKGIVLIHGRRCPVVGRVSLNVTTVDVTDLPDRVQVGDEAVLVGRQDGEEMTFEELADLFDSVHTEINLMLGHMSEVRYLPAATPSRPPRPAHAKSLR